MGKGEPARAHSRHRNKGFDIKEHSTPAKKPLTDVLMCQAPGHSQTRLFTFAGERQTRKDLSWQRHLLKKQDSCVELITGGKIGPSG